MVQLTANDPSCTEDPCLVDQLPGLGLTNPQPLFAYTASPHKEARTFIYSLRRKRAAEFMTLPPMCTGDDRHLILKVHRGSDLEPLETA